MNDYGWRSRRGLVIVDGGLDRVPTVWREKKEIKIVNKQGATVESLIDGHLACVASVSSRGSSRKLGQEQKNG